MTAASQRSRSHGNGLRRQGRPAGDHLLGRPASAALGC